MWIKKFGILAIKQKSPKFLSFFHRSQTTVGPVLDNVVELEETFDRHRISSAFHDKTKNQLSL
jgi:hypothetical protein